MKIAVVNPIPLDQDLLGGGGVVFINIVRILKDRGHNIDLYTSFYSYRSRQAINDSVNKIVVNPLFRPFSTLVTLSPFFVFGVARLHLVSSYFRSFEGYDYSICTAYDGLIGHYDLGYIHYPARKYFRLADITKIRSFTDFLNYITSFNFKDKTKRLVTNSKYTAKLLYERAKKTADVLYPLVRLINCKDEGKDNVVVSLGRISREKKYEDVIYAAEALKDTKFIIVGRVQDEKYYEELRRRSPSNVSFATNASEEEKQQVLCKAKVILHPKREEPFGIAIVEGMSAGAIPTVYKNGGAWFDIVSEGRFGYGYERIEELPELIKQALSDDKLRKEVKERATMFSDKNFMENFLKITGL
jgi:glycosyltransferase involved in cell wall biosynthesis